MTERDARLDVRVTDARGRPLRVAGLARWLARVAPAGWRGSVTIALVSDRRMRALNRAYRGEDYATDVLSFPVRDAHARDHERTGSAKADVRAFLGDIAIARSVARRQAREAGHAESTELRILALHGLLHLLGHDHERDDGQMRRLETGLRRKGGLPLGLIERFRASAPEASQAPRRER